MRPRACSRTVSSIEKRGPDGESSRCSRLWSTSAASRSSSAPQIVFGRLERAAAREDGERRKVAALDGPRRSVLHSRVARSVCCRAGRSLGPTPSTGAVARDARAGSTPTASARALRRARRRAGAVELAAHRPQRLFVHRPPLPNRGRAQRTLHEQRERIVLPKRLHRVHLLARQMEHGSCSSRPAAAEAPLRAAARPTGPRGAGARSCRARASARVAVTTPRCVSTGGSPARSAIPSLCISAGRTSSWSAERTRGRRAPPRSQIVGHGPRERERETATSRFPRPRQGQETSIVGRRAESARRAPAPARSARFGGTGSCGRLGWRCGRPSTGSWRRIAPVPAREAPRRAPDRAPRGAPAPVAVDLAAHLPAVRSGTERQHQLRASRSRSGCCATRAPQLGKSRPRADRPRLRARVAPPARRVGALQAHRLCPRAKPSSATSASAEPRHSAALVRRTRLRAARSRRQRRAAFLEQALEPRSRRALLAAPGARIRARRSRSAARARACAAARRRHGPACWRSPADGRATGRPRGDRRRPLRSRRSSAASSADASPHRAAPRPPSATSSTRAEDRRIRMPVASLD